MYFSPRRGIEPRSPAWQAGILTTILPRIPHLLRANIINSFKSTSRFGWWNSHQLEHWILARKKTKKHQMRHKPGISKHYSTMRNFYNLICLDTCETYESFVGDFFLLSFLWIDSTLTFDLLPWSDETLSARLNFFGGLILQILGEIIRKKNDSERLEGTNFRYCSWIYGTIPRIRTYSLHFSWFFQVS